MLHAVTNINIIISSKELNPERGRKPFFLWYFSRIFSSKEPTPDRGRKLFKACHFPSDNFRSKGLTPDRGRKLLCGNYFVYLFNCSKELNPERGRIKRPRFRSRVFFKSGLFWEEHLPFIHKKSFIIYVRDVITRRWDKYSTLFSIE